MNILKTKIDFQYIAKKETEAKKFFESKIDKTDKNISDINKYKKPLKFLYNTLISMKHDSELKNYIAILEKTNGDYIKRDSKIYNKVALMYSFINDEIIKNDSDLEHSLAGIYKKAFDILTSPKYLNMFKTVFNILQKKGELNSSLTIFKLIYIALAYMVEMSTLYLVEYELDIYNGVDKKSAMLNLMDTYYPFMKNVVIPMIDIIEFLNSLKNPVVIITQISTEEDKIAKDNKNNTKESSSYDFTEMKNKDIGEESVLSILTTSISTFAGVSIPVYLLALLVLVSLIPLVRRIIYWAKIRKIDVGKELELKAEMLDNNIVLLKQKLDKTTDPEERDKLISIINKQEAYVRKWKDESRKRLGNDITTSYEVEDTIKSEDSQQTDTSDEEIIL